MKNGTKGRFRQRIHRAPRPFALISDIRVNPRIPFTFPNQFRLNPTQSRLEKHIFPPLPVHALPRLTFQKPPVTQTETRQIKVKHGETRQITPREYPARRLSPPPLVLRHPAQPPVPQRRSCPIVPNRTSGEGYHPPSPPQLRTTNYDYGLIHISSNQDALILCLRQFGDSAIFAPTICTDEQHN